MLSTEALLQILEIATKLTVGVLPLGHWIILLSITAALFFFKFKEIKQSKFLKWFITIGVIAGALLGAFPALFLSVMATGSGTTQSMMGGGVLFVFMELVSAFAGFLVATPVGYTIFKLRKTA